MATFKIDDDVPAPNKPTVSNDGWATGVKTTKPKPATALEGWQAAISGLITEVGQASDEWANASHSREVFPEPITVRAGEHLCTLIGGPLNGQRGAIRGEAKTVELEIYGPNGDVTSVELYALGDNPTPTFRYHVGTKEP